MTIKMGMLSGVIKNKCPYCFNGNVFNGFLTLNKRCPNCEAIFLKEEGYFLGSMIAAYFFSAFTVIPVFVIGAFVYQLEISVLIWIGSVQVTLLSPFLYRYATILWLWVETVLNQKLDDADQK